MNLKFRKSVKGKKPGKDIQKKKRRRVLRSRGRRLKLRASSSGVESDGIFRFRNTDEYGRLQSIDGQPALIAYYPGGQTPSEKRWYDKGVLYSFDDRPAWIKYYQSGAVSEERWYRRGELHRFDGPALITYFPNGVVSKSVWYWDDSIRRQENPGDPAVEIYDYDMDTQNFYLKEKQWYDGYNSRGRVTEPAVVTYYPSGDIASESWFTEDVPDREDGPAVITYYVNGQVKTMEWWIAGEELTEEEFNERTNPQESTMTNEGPSRQVWRNRSGELHRRDGPAVTEFYSTGIKSLEEWWVDGERYREDINLPDVVRYYNFDDNRIMREEWHQGNDELGRYDDLPAVIEYYVNGYLKMKEWWVDGVMERDNDEPARIFYSENKAGRQIRNDWYVDGVPGREVPDGEDEADYPGAVELYDDEENGVEGEAWFESNGELRESITYYNNDEGRIFKREFFEYGMLGSRDSPSVLYYFDTPEERVAKEQWYLNGSLGRMGGLPQEVSYFDDDAHRIEQMKWSIDGELGRESDKPAVVTFFNNNSHRIEKREWYIVGLPDREDGKATTRIYYDNERNSIRQQRWETIYLEDKILYRRRGPAVIDYDENGNIINRGWYDLNGRKITEEQYNRHIGVGHTLQIAREEEIIEEELPENLPPKEEPPRTIMPNDEPEKCKITLKGLDENSPEFLRSLNDLISSCNLLETASRPGYVNKVREEAKEELTVGTRINVKVDAGKEFLKIMSYPGDYLMIVNESHLNVQYREQAGIDAGGLRLQFITSIFQQIKSTLFKPIELHSTNTDQKAVTRYYIDHEISDDEIRLRLSLPPTANIDDVFEKAGNMFGNAVINGVDTDIPLSRVLYNFMLSPVPEDYDAINQVITSDNKTAVLYYLLDISTLISKIAISEDYEELFWDVAKGVYEIPEGSTRMLSFLRGFESMGTFLRERFVNANELLDLTTGTLTREKMSAFLNSGLVKYELQIPGTADERPLTNDEKQTFINEFILPVEDYKQFMFWWSGEPRIRQDKEYRFYFTEAVSGDFVSHTCSTQIDIKPYTLDPSDPRFRKAADWLKRAIYIVEFGIA